MANDQTNRVGTSIDGISMASFLQLLEMERKSCTLVVTRGNKKGHLYFQEGQLIDAEYVGIFGLEAAYVILSWDSVKYSLAREVQRMRRISHSLGHIILNATAKAERMKEGVAKGVKRKTAAMSSAKGRGLANFISQLVAIPGVLHYYLLNSQGKLLAQSGKDAKIGDFIAYTIVSGMQMREALEAGRLNHVKIQLGNGTMLLIVYGGGMNVGLLLEAETSVSEVFTLLRQAVR